MVRAARLHRRSERGASVFIVLLVITLLTAIGIFSARSASLVDQAAGYDRQLVQTQYLTEFAGRAVSAELGDGAGKTYLDKVQQGTDTCETNQNVLPLAPGTPIPCYKLYISEIADRVNAKTGTTLIENQTVVVSGGSLGPKLGVAGLIHGLRGCLRRRDDGALRNRAQPRLGGGEGSKAMRFVTCN